MAGPGKAITREEVLAALGLDEEFLVSLERETIVRTDAGGLYSVEMVERIRICQTLHEDLGVNFAGLEVALNLLERIRAERRQFNEVLTWLRDTLKSGRP